MKINYCITFRSCFRYLDNTSTSIQIVTVSRYTSAHASFFEVVGVAGAVAHGKCSHAQSSSRRPMHDRRASFEFSSHCILVWSTQVPKFSTAVQRLWSTLRPQLSNKGHKFSYVGTSIVPVCMKVRTCIEFECTMYHAALLNLVPTLHMQVLWNTSTCTFKYSYKIVQVHIHVMYYDPKFSRCTSKYFKVLTKYFKVQTTVLQVFKVLGTWRTSKYFKAW